MGRVLAPGWHFSKHGVYSGEGADALEDDEVADGCEFKRCPCCGELWPSRADFLADPALEVVGYQADFRDLRLGLFLFNHDRCGTTLSAAAGEFADLYRGPVFAERKTGSDECPGYCLDRSILGGCSTECECAFVREVLQEVRRRLAEARNPAAPHGAVWPDAEAG